MSVIDLRTNYAINYPIDCNNTWQRTLILGHGRMIYLYYILPPFYSICKLQKAELILFQYPSPPCDWRNLTNNQCGRNQYALYSVQKPLNVYYRFAASDIDSERCIVFGVSNQQGYVANNITTIVQGWLSGVANSGLLLTSSGSSNDVFFASGKFDLPWMRPMLRLTCECKGLQPTLCSVPCDVKVTRP